MKIAKYREINRRSRLHFIFGQFNRLRLPHVWCITVVFVHAIDVKFAHPRKLFTPGVRSW